MKSATMLLAVIVLSISLTHTVIAAACMPTAPDQLGPFYQPDAPVRSSRDCAAISGATSELWLAGPDGGCDEAHRATVIADERGSYRFESNTPPPYYGRPPHIHLRVSAKGFESLVTQHYPGKGRRSADVDIVLVPLR